MKRSVIVFIIIAFFVSLCFSENEYTNRWPIINDNSVNARDYPDIKLGNVVFKLSKNQKINIRYKTKQKYLINGYSDYWYNVSIQSGDNHINELCWVFGQFISFKDGFAEDYWNKSIFPIKSIDQRVAYRNILINKILYSLYGKTIDGAYSTDLISSFNIKNSGDTGLWYMKESGYVEANTYYSPFGELTAFVNSKEKKWSHIETIINKNFNNFGINIGMNINDLEILLGDEYTKKDNFITYNYNENFDAYFLTFEVTNNLISSFKIETFYD